MILPDSWNKSGKPSAGSRKGSSWRVNLAAGTLVVFVGFAWLIALTDRVILPFISRADVEMSMPDLRRMTYAQAGSLCKVSRLELMPARIRSDDKAPVGVVLDQYPHTGSIIKPGRRVEVVVSGNSGLIACPDVVGKSPREAGLIADSSGLWLNMEAIRYQFSENDPEGVIIEQSPFALTGLLKGAEMRITISLGSAPAIPTVPDLIGVNIENASFMLRKQGLRLGEIITYPDRKHHPGTVIEQSRLPGDPAGEGDIVDVRIATQPVGGFFEDGDSSNIYFDTTGSSDSEHE